MNLPRIFAQAAVRRAAYVLVALVFAYLSIGNARAQTYPDQGSAYAGCMTAARQYLADMQRTNPYPQNFRNPHCSLPSSGGMNRYQAKIESWNSMQQKWNIAYHSDHWWTAGSTCSTRPSSTTPYLPATGSTQCWNGCEVTYAQNADETSTRSTTGDVCDGDTFKDSCPEGSFWNGYMSVCEPIQKQCPEGQEEKDGQCLPSNKCPAGMVSVQGSTPGAIQQGSLYCKPSKEECPPGDVTTTGGQCLPGEGKCAQGEARGGDGTCKRDADGDGVADDEDDNPDNDSQKDSFSGGDNCDSPPSCNGNPIMCGQARIQWRIDCNTRRAQNISGGTCDAVPICTGKACDAMEYAQLLQQWRSTCALEEIAKQQPGQGGGENAQGDANGNGVADVLEGRLNSPGAGDGQGDVDGSKSFGIGVNTGMLNSEAIFGGGSCPRLPSFQLYGQTISADDFPYWCDAMVILRGLVLLFGAFTALKILMGWGF